MKEEIENLKIQLHKERCARIKVEKELEEKSKAYEHIISALKLQLYLSKKNWWKKFRLPKLVWRDEYEDD